MNDITKIKVDGETESSYQLYPRNEEFAKRAGGNTGSHSGVQPDWNQNDSTQPDYVKNRPFYTGGPVETVFVEESTVPFAPDGGGRYTGQLESTFVPTVGETYKVYWDGSAYESTCVSVEGTLAIGNLSILGAGSDTGEPFLIGVLNDKRIKIGTADTSASHTISISRFVQEVVKIDPKYIRDMYYTADPVETVLVEESTVSFAAADGVYMGELESTFVPTVGETYKVSWDGTVYESTCVNFNRFQVIGNLSILGYGPDTGEPFLIVVGNGKRIKIGTADTSASHTISISGYAESVVKIDQKYLPVASKTEPGIIALDNLDNNVLSLVREAYFTPNSLQVSGYGDANRIKEVADKNNSHGIFSSGKFGGAVLSCYNDSVNQYITFVLTGGKNIECWKSSLSSTERLWGIFEDGVVISSSTPDSTKKFKITVDDSGNLTATEVT